MVMTMTIAGLLAAGQTVISDIECVKKTFPDFVSQMQGIRCDMRKQ